MLIIHHIHVIKFLISSFYSSEKIFFGFKAAFAVLAWALMATLRRITALVVFFIPSVGLFDILYHWHAEQFPFKMRTWQSTVLPIDNIELFNMTESIKWKELDRWRYEDPKHPTPPSYTLYTGFTLKYTFGSLFVIMFFHCLSIFLVKMFTSKEFSSKGNLYSKLIHVMETMNLPFPFVDWDQGHFTVEEYRQRYWNTEKEMIISFMVNFLFNIIMLFPLWLTGMGSCPVTLNPESM